MAMPSNFIYKVPLKELGLLEEITNSLDIESGILFGLDALMGSGSVLALNNPTGYDFTSLKYPDDIEHFFMHGHYMNFFVNVPVWSKYWQEGFVPGALPIPGLSTLGEYAETTKDYFGYDLPHPEQLNDAGSAINAIKNTRITQAISLYIPDSVSYMSTVNYEQTSVAGEGKKLMKELDTALQGFFSKGIAGKFNQTIGGIIGATEVAGGAMGFAVNENLLVLFRSMGLRQFAYDFFFSPKSAKEAQAVRNIITSFRFHAHPEVKFGYGLLYVAPGTFDITFMHRGKENENIHKVSTCVLTNVDVDYAPLGWSTHTDGMPIQTRLSLRFTETEIMTKEKIYAGY